MTFQEGTEKESDADRMKPEFKYYDFFAGAGLVQLGLGDRWECLWANDNDRTKEKVYEANFGANAFSFGDVQDVEASDLPRAAHMAWSSFPCQDLSLAGWRRGMSAERSGTFWAFWRIMRDLHDQGDRPPVMTVENVTGLLRGDDFSGLCEALAALDMKFGALVVDARYFLPHSRPRVFVVAVDARVECKGLYEEQPTHSEWVPNSLINGWKTLPDTLKKHWRWWKLPVPDRRRVDIREVVEEDPTGVDWYPASKVERLLSLMNDRHRGKVEDAQKAGTKQIGFLYKRTRQGQQRAEVRFDGIAGCLRTPAGGSSRQTVVVVKGDEVKARLLSPREAARLMGAPDSFSLPSNYNDAYHAMGDGVAVPVVSWIAEHLLEPLARRSQEAADEELVGSPDRDRINGHRDAAEKLAARWEASS